MKNKFMILYSPSDKNDKERKGIHSMDDLFRIRDYVYRTCYGIENLKEKVRMFELNYYDIGIEKLKMIIRDRLSSKYSDYHITFIGQNNYQKQKLLFRIWKEDEESSILKFPLDEYNKIEESVLMDSKYDIDDWDCGDSIMVKE